MTIGRDIEVLVKFLRDALDSIDWTGREKHPTLRKGVAGRQIENFEKKIGGTLPNDYRMFLLLANGMEGGVATDWLIRGTSEPRVGVKFKNIERDFFSTNLEEARLDFYRNEISPTYENCLIIGSDFHTDIAVMRRFDDIYDDIVELYRAPDLIDPLIVFDSFNYFLAFLVSVYESKLDDNESIASDNSSVESDSDLLEGLDFVGDCDCEEESSAVVSTQSEKKKLPIR